MHGYLVWSLALGNLTAHPRSFREQHESGGKVTGLWSVSEDNTISRGQGGENGQAGETDAGHAWGQAGPW